MSLRKVAEVAKTSGRQRISPANGNDWEDGSTKRSDYERTRTTKWFLSKMQHYAVCYIAFSIRELLLWLFRSFTSFAGRKRDLCALGPHRAAFALILLLPGCSIMQPMKPGHPEFEKFSSAEHSDFGVVYETAGDLRAARRQFEYAVRKDPGNHVAWTNLGNIHAQQGHWDRARDAYLHALALHPGYGPAVINLAHAYLNVSPPAPQIATAVLDAQKPLLTPEYLQAAEKIVEEILNESMVR